MEDGRKAGLKLGWETGGGRLGLDIRGLWVTLQPISRQRPPAPITINKKLERVKIDPGRARDGAVSQEDAPLGGPRLFSGVSLGLQGLKPGPLPSKIVEK